MTDNDFDLEEQRERTRKQIMARKAKKQKNQEPSASSEPNRFLKKEDGDDDTDSRTSMLNLNPGASKQEEKNGLQPPVNNLKAQKSKGNQVFDLILANAKGKDGDVDDYYYEIYYQNAIKRCNVYWKRRDYENDKHRKAWERRNEILEKADKPTIWDPFREAQIRDTEDFWRGESREDVLSDSNTARWMAENKRRAAEGKLPLDRDRVRPWSEFPIYVPYDHMGDSPPLGVPLGRTISTDVRLNDREIRYARTRCAEFTLPPDVDAVPLLLALEGQWKNDKDATVATDKNAAPGKKDVFPITSQELLGLNHEEMIQADAPAGFAEIMTAFLDQIPNAANPHGTGKAENSTWNKTAAAIHSVKETPKATDEMVEDFREVAGPQVPRSEAVFYLEARDCVVPQALDLFFSSDAKPVNEMDIDDLFLSAETNAVDDEMDVDDDQAFGTTGGGKTTVWNVSKRDAEDSGSDGKGGKDGPWTQYEEEFCG
ncbi:hypothetical protein E2P81_ATG09871 [Venturia nashicola]|uniref:Uncharacterized protein n=1 Tax=Venturia nashicola TaxID=86259 RepID=A0A4Z1NC53_9PEZI|nr:hypothetical protein E6O75_ATG10088 [Venturia nashicola]TLD15023.1 hypothetical protein E2P81_ATG09871 [Venturia nashicola]